MIEAMFEDIALSILRDEIEHTNQMRKAANATKKKTKKSKKAEADQEHNTDDTHGSEDHSDNIEVTGVRDITDEERKKQDNDIKDQDLELSVETVPKDTRDKKPDNKEM
jgi:hypothetical protein